jgi:phosphate transport system substrate-binding protein
MKRMTRWLVGTAFILALMAACIPAVGTGESTAKPAKTISISGAFAIYPLMQTWSEAYHKDHPEVTFDISAGGAGKGMLDTLSGTVDIGMISREISPDEEAKGAVWVAVAKDAVFPMVNANNPVLSELQKQGVTRAVFTGIYVTGKITTWGQVVGRPEITDPIHLYTRSDACGAADTWAKTMGKAQENLLGIGVSGDPGILDAVAKDPLGIGYNNLAYAFDPQTGQSVQGTAVVPFDANENGTADPDERFANRAEALTAINTGEYPSPPARLLYLATKGRPSGAVQAFLQWILTDGQKLVAEAGFIELAPEQLNASQKKLQ